MAFDEAAARSLLNKDQRGTEKWQAWFAAKSAHEPAGREPGGQAKGQGGKNG